jgi:hypothetical protein
MSAFSQVLLLLVTTTHTCSAVAFVSSQMGFKLNPSKTPLGLDMAVVVARAAAWAAVAREVHLPPLLLLLLHLLVLLVVLPPPTLLWMIYQGVLEACYHLLLLSL